MAHISKESTLQTAGFFSTVLRFSQSTLRLFQFIFQFLSMIVEVQRNKQSTQQYDQDRTNSPDMIFILFVKRWSFIDHFYRLMNGRQIQTLIFHNLAIHLYLIRNYLYFHPVAVRSLQQTNRLMRHILTQCPVRGDHSTYRPIAYTYRSYRKSRNITGSLHHRISRIAHKVSVIHIYAPSTQ